MDTLDHPAVDEGTGRSAADVELDSAFALDDADVEVFVAFEQLLAVVERVAAIEHRQRTAAEDFEQAVPALVQQSADLRAGEDFQTAFGRDLGVDEIWEMHGVSFLAA